MRPNTFNSTCSSSMLMVPLYDRKPLRRGEEGSSFDGLHLTFRSSKVIATHIMAPTATVTKPEFVNDQTANGREHDDTAVDTTATLSSHVYSDY